MKSKTTITTEIWQRTVVKQTVSGVSVATDVAQLDIDLDSEGTTIAKLPKVENQAISDGEGEQK